MKIKRFNSLINIKDVAERAANANKYIIIHSHSLLATCCNLLGVKVEDVESIAFSFSNKQKILQEINDVHQDGNLIVIASYYHTSIFHWLLDKSEYKFLNDIVLYEHLVLADFDDVRRGFGGSFWECYEANQDKFEHVYSLLDDLSSKDTFEKVINFRAHSLSLDVLSPQDIPLSLDEQINIEESAINYIANIPSNVPENLVNNVTFKLAVNEYSYKDIVTLQDKKTILNCGAYNNSSIVFSILAPKAAIHAFEPQLNIHQENIGIAKKLPNIIPLNLGVWENKCRLYFSQNIDSGGSSTSSHITEDKKESNAFIDVTSIDEYVEENNICNVDFIKMDVEGAEIEALKGAENTIKHFSPQLAISIYHKPEHLFEIPLLIKTLLPEYKLYISHKYPGICETVCFATL